MDIKNTIVHGVEKLNLSLSPIQLEKIQSYIELLLKWNKVYNLTSITSPKEIAVRHILDSLSIIKYIGDSKSLIDIGSGAGLPGIVIAIIKPDCKITLLDTNSKRTAFLNQVRINLKLDNVNVVNQRVEDYQPLEKFATIISRAFTQLHNYVELTQHLLQDSGIIFAMKGKLQDNELSELRSKVLDYKIVDIHDISVPYLNESRHLISITRV